MSKPRPHLHKHSFESVCESAKLCSSNSQFRKMFGGPWDYARRHGFLHDLFPPRFRYNLENSIEFAKSCKSRSELLHKYDAAYRILSKAGLLDELLPKLPSREIKWTPETLMDASKKCPRGEFYKLGGAYTSLERLNLTIDDVYPEFRKWTKASVFELAESCSSFKEFRSHRGAYKAAKVNGWAGEIKAMFPSGFRENRGYTFSGWSAGKDSASLYILEVEDETEFFLKIGITTQSIETRFRSVGHLPYEHWVAFEVSASPRFIWDLEKYLIRKLSSYHYVPTLPFSGHTNECFQGITSDKIIEMISV